MMTVKALYQIIVAINHYFLYLPRNIFCTLVFRHSPRSMFLRLLDCSRHNPLRFISSMNWNNWKMQKVSNDNLSWLVQHQHFKIMMSVLNTNLLLKCFMSMIFFWLKVFKHVRNAYLAMQSLTATKNVKQTVCGLPRYRIDIVI